jgi:putative surface protein
MAENERVSYENKWYYAGSDGAIVTDKWESINGKDYYFNSNGDLLVNTVVDGHNVDANGVKIR